MANELTGNLVFSLELCRFISHETTHGYVASDRTDDVALMHGSKQRDHGPEENSCQVLGHQFLDDNPSISGVYLSIKLGGIPHDGAMTRSDIITLF